jgi:hypothetical protein
VKRAKLWEVNCLRFLTGERSEAGSSLRKIGILILSPGDLQVKHVVQLADLLSAHNLL